MLIAWKKKKRKNAVHKRKILKINQFYAWNLQSGKLKSRNMISDELYLENTMYLVGYPRSNIAASFTENEKFRK